MKRILFIFIAASLMFACVTGVSKYEKVIATAVQTKNGKLYDLKFKALEITEQQKITVADSVKILREEFEIKNASDSEYAQNVLDLMTMIATSKKANNMESSEITAKQDIQKAVIDSIRSVKFIVSEKYAGKSDGDVIYFVVRCNYEITIPGGSSTVTVTETFDFYLSPDGQTYYQMKKVK